MNDENEEEEEEECFYLYHSFGLSAGYEKMPASKMLDLVRRDGLLSHSTKGRRKDDEGGTIIALTRDRIWFSKRMGCEFTKFTDPLVLRVRFDEEEFEDKFGIVHDDDQYFGNEKCEVFIEDVNEFAIPPWDIDIWNGKEWEPLSPFVKGWKYPRRSEIERMQPSIQEDFKRLGLRPWNDFEVKAYVYIQPDDNMPKDEFWALAEEQSEEINLFVVFDYETC